MSCKKIVYTLSATAILLSFSSLAPGAELQLWSVDPLVKVFRDAEPQPAGTAVDHVARGEYGEFQIVVRSDTSLDTLSASVTDFSNAVSGTTIPGASVRFVGYVHVDRPSQRPSLDQLRQPPADFPDVLLEDASVSVPSEQAQPVWISVHVPPAVPEGAYQASVTVRSDSGGITQEATYPLKLVVYPITVDSTRLWVTNWFSMQWRHMEINPEPDSAAYYDLLRRYARNMAEHRQNAALISPLALSRFYVNAEGALAVDFEKFDRWVQIFIDEGVIGRIEGGHIGGRSGGWDSDFITYIHSVQDGAVTNGSAAPDSEEARTFYGFFYPALTAHLKEKGWLDIYMQHLADEPTQRNMGTYKALAALVHEFAPELRIIEANHTKELVGSMDIWVPQLNFFHEDFGHYQERQKNGDEVWFYTCVFPQGEYANRFIELPLIKTRLLHWINFTAAPQATCTGDTMRGKTKTLGFIQPVNITDRPIFLPETPGLCIRVKRDPSIPSALKPCGTVSLTMSCCAVWQKKILKRRIGWQQVIFSILTATIRTLRPFVQHVLHCCRHWPPLPE